MSATHSALTDAAEKAGCLAVELSVSFRWMMGQSEYVAYRCVACGEGNETFVDLSAGSRQTYVEDCTVCCRPNVLSVQIHEEDGRITLEAELEG